MAAPAAEPCGEVIAAALERGRRLLGRLHWTGRAVELGSDGMLLIRPPLGRADRFGQDVAAHPGDIVRALRAEAREGASP